MLDSLGKLRRPFFMISLAFTLGIGALLFRMMAIPIGGLFNACLGLFAASAISQLLLLTLLCLRSRRRWLSFFGILPALLATLFGIAVVLFIFDVRRLWFMGFPPKPNAAAWAVDLQVLAERLKARPLSLTHRVSAEALDTMVHEIETALPRMSKAQVTMTLFRLCAQAQDAHSMPFIFLPCFDLHGFPIRVFRFEEGWFIVDAGRSQRPLIGSRITKIGTMEVEELFRRLPDHLGVESEWGCLDRANWLLYSEWLQSMGAIGASEPAIFTLEARNGETLRVKLPTEALSKILAWQNLTALPNDTSSVFTNPRQDWYRFDLQEKTRFRHPE